MTGKIDTVRVLLSDEYGRMLFVERDEDSYNGKWVLPGGKVDPGQTLVDACSEEILQETGLLIYDIRPTFIQEDMFGSIISLKSVTGSQPYISESNNSRTAPYETESYHNSIPDILNLISLNDSGRVNKGQSKIFGLLTPSNLSNLLRPSSGSATSRTSGIDAISANGYNPEGRVHQSQQDNNQPDYHTHKGHAQNNHKIPQDNASDYRQESSDPRKAKVLSLNDWKKKIASYGYPSRRDDSLWVTHYFTAAFIGKVETNSEVKSHAWLTLDDFAKYDIVFGNDIAAKAFIQKKDPEQLAPSAPSYMPTKRAQGYGSSW